MRKILLSIAVAATAFTAAADVIVDVETRFSDYTEFPFYVMDNIKPAIVDGVLVAENKTATDNYKYQYFVADGFALSEQDYTVTALIKSNVSGDINVVLGDWSDSNNGTMTVNGDNQWKEVSAKIPGIKLNAAHVIFQSGAMVGTYEIQWIKVTHDGTPVTLPATGDIIASFYTGNGMTIGGWGGGSFDNVDEDGKPCLRFSNSTAASDAWSIQMAIDATLKKGETYYLGFDIKGDNATGLETGIQDTNDYSARGTFTKFSINGEWNHVIIKGECTGEPADRIVFNLGKYTGTFYMTGVTLYTASQAGIDNPAAADDTPSHWTVYNMYGIKILDTDDKSMLSTIPKGIYIINGKKTAVTGR